MTTATTWQHSFANPQASTGWARVLWVLAGTCVLTASSYVQVPMVPVPMTMQTLAVTLVGALYGWRLGALTVLAWLAQAALGLPVLAGGAGGWIHLIGKTGGYLFAFVLAAAWVGFLVERGCNGRHPLRAFAAFTLGNALCLALGGMWLATFIGSAKAWQFGVEPFVLGGLLKSVLGAALLKLADSGQPSGDAAQP